MAMRWIRERVSKSMGVGGAKDKEVEGGNAMAHRAGRTTSVTAMAGPSELDARAFARALKPEVREALKVPVAKRTEEHHKVLVKALVPHVVKNPLFAAYPEHARDICKLFTLEKHDTNSVVILQGDVGHKFYLVAAGKCRITVQPQRLVDSRLSAEAAGVPADKGDRLPGMVREPTFRRVMSKSRNFVYKSARSLRRILSTQRREKKERRRVVQKEAETLFDVLPLGSFGELALINDRPRNASVTAVETAELLVLTKEAFEPIIRAAAEKAVWAMDCLRGAAAFQGLVMKDDYLHALSSLCTERQYDGGETEFFVDKTRALQFITQGTAYVCRLKPELLEPGAIREYKHRSVVTGGDGKLKEGQHFIELTRLEAGQHFGEGCLFPEQQLEPLLVRSGPILRVLQVAKSDYDAWTLTLPEELRRAVSEQVISPTRGYLARGNSMN